MADKLGYEQSYISAIELGTKGPPSTDFIETLISCLELDGEWQARVAHALEESQRKMILPNEASEDVYRMFNELRRQLEGLHPAQVELIEMALRLPKALAKQSLNRSLPPRRVREREKDKSVET
jgi:transcriptional regulator with XRE-family HTH domain